MSRVSRWVGRRFAGRDTWGFAVRLELELPQLLAPGFLRPTTARSSLKCKRALVPVAQAGLFPVAQAGSGGSGRTKRFRGVKRFFSLSLSALRIASCVLRSDCTLRRHRLRRLLRRAAHQVLLRVAERQPF